MSLEKSIRDQIQTYCTKDLPGDLNWHIQRFHFIDDAKLQDRLGRAFYAARYMAKLMEALYVKDNELHPFVKFQVMQYAAIYEAVISHLLWTKFRGHQEVIALQTHKSYKPISALSNLTTITYDGEHVYTCVHKEEKTPKNSISFGDKVDCGVRIGFIDATYAEDLKRIYTRRNLAHIETEAKKQIEIEIEDAKLGYWRMQPFIDQIERFLGTSFS
jgi:hypothetical protein